MKRDDQSGSAAWGSSAAMDVKDDDDGGYDVT
jgi:hypothetical protein